MTADVDSGGAPVPPGDDDAWAQVLAGWDDDAAHRAFLARFTDLDGLAGAGARYRAVLAERPGDAVALRWRDEVVKRATAAGLAALPRTRPLPAVPRTVKLGAAAAVFAVVLGAFAWFAVRAFDLFSRGRP